MYLRKVQQITLKYLKSLYNAILSHILLKHGGDVTVLHTSVWKRYLQLTNNMKNAPKMQHHHEVLKTLKHTENAPHGQGKDDC